VDESGLPWSQGLGAWHDDRLEGMTALARTIHKAGATASIQFVHGGLQASPSVPSVCVVGSSTVLDSAELHAPRPLTISDSE